MTLEALAAESALREAMNVPVYDRIDYGSDAARRKRSAMHGFKVALPFAALLWTLIAGMLWVMAR
jgi:hypothetical protein